MEDYRLVAARKLVWDKEAWRKPAVLLQAINWLEQIVADQSGTVVAHAEAQMLINKLHQAAKQPTLE